MKNLTKLGVASALISVSLLFCACGDNNEFKPSSEAEKKALALLKEKYPNYKKIYNYEFVAKQYDVVKDGKTLQQCLNNENQVVFFASSYENSNYSEEQIFVTASAFIFNTQTNDIKKTQPELFLVRDYMQCLKSIK